MKFLELKEDLVVTDWFGTIIPSKNTERNYLLSIKTYCEWTGKTPEELLTEAEEEIKAGLLMRQRSIKKKLIGFRRSLQDKGLAPMTIRLYMAGLKSFYRTADIELPSLPRAEKAIPLEKHIKIPSKEDLREVLKICDPMEKAILLVGASSGLSANEIVDLKIGDFKNGYDSETGITTLKLRRKKVKYDFITFLSPEASKAVSGYINYRGRTPKVDCTRREKQLDKQKVYSIDDYLLVVYTSY